MSSFFPLEISWKKKAKLNDFSSLLSLPESPGKLCKRFLIELYFFVSGLDL